MKGEFSEDGMTYELRGPKGGEIYRAELTPAGGGRWDWRSGSEFGTLEAPTEEEAKALFLAIVEEGERRVLKRRWK